MSFSELGCDLHLHHIRSHEKLTLGGIHFLPCDLERLIDEVLLGEPSAARPPTIN